MLRICSGFSAYLYLYVIFRRGGDLLDWLTWSYHMLPLSFHDHALFTNLVKYQASVSCSVMSTKRPAVLGSAHRIWLRILRKVRSTYSFHLI